VKISEVRERTSEELVALVSRLQADLFKLRVRQATNQLADTSTIRAMRRDIAKAQTVQRARELGREAGR
jgi:large subunit ribosomal protein L29